MKYLDITSFKQFLSKFLAIAFYMSIGANCTNAYDRSNSTQALWGGGHSIF